MGRPGSRWSRCMKCCSSPRGLMRRRRNPLGPLNTRNSRKSPLPRVPCVPWAALPWLLVAAMSRVGRNTRASFFSYAARPGGNRSPSAAWGWLSSSLMNRRTFLTQLGAVGALAPLSLRAAEAKKTPAGGTFFSRLQPAVVGGGFELPDHWVWCGAPIRGEDGKYHLFASRIPGSASPRRGCSRASQRTSRIRFCRMRTARCRR